MEKKEIELKHWTDEWLSEYVQGTVIDNTYRSYKTCLNCYYRYCKEPNEPLSQLSSPQLRTVLVSMANDGISRSTIDKCKQLIIRAVLDAYDMGYDVDPNIHVRIPRNAKEKKYDAVTPEEQAYIELVCTRITNGRLLLFLLDTGLRGSELCNLTWADYDGAGITIERTKTEKGCRYLPLTRRAKIIIESQPRINDHIFNSEVTHTPVTYTVLRTAYRRVREITGIQQFSTRVCRHSFATRLFEADANPKSVSELMGHTSVAFTLQRYTTISRGALVKSIALLDQKYS